MFVSDTDMMVNCKQYHTLQKKYDRVVENDLVYIFIQVLLIFGGFISLIFLVKKFGVKRTCKGVRFVVSFHWLLKFIIYLRLRIYEGPSAVVNEAMMDIVENDEEYVKKEMNKSSDAVDNTAPASKQKSQALEIKKRTDRNL